ncbi:MAG: malate dehydrogenase (quinone) [Hahellaceae bacterium]|nr:malate dehydrogenase (quinone) [Hahellaceae bacterium]
MSRQTAEVVLVGGGIMSATLGMIIRQLEPDWSITLIERLPNVAEESSDGWNNAGTGHAGYCELNYTPAAGNQIDISKALQINAQFEVSLQWWSSLLKAGLISKPDEFIRRVPHYSFVWGDEDVAFLKRRQELLKQHHLFKDIQFSGDAKQLEAWMPLVMSSRKPGGAVAATRVEHGTDVDFGALTRMLVKQLGQTPNTEILTGTSVIGLKREGKEWLLTLQKTGGGERMTRSAQFVFLGAGGGALPLLQKSGIPEASGYGGFPISGQWLACRNGALAQKHSGKVYGKAPVGAPPMSVPHLDTRVINGESSLLFGPFAGFTTRFLKQGSVLDLIKSVRPGNLGPMISVGLHNWDLTRYLIREVRQCHADRMESLKTYFPEARAEDWKLIHAGQRVQIIKRDANGKGKLEFGTEVVAAQDGSLAALLGASPGASVAVHAMLQVLERCYPQRYEAVWRKALAEWIPQMAGQVLQHPEQAMAVRRDVLNTLNIQ